MARAANPPLTDAAGQPEAICAPEHRRALLIAAILASALAFIDGTVVAIAMPALRSSLPASLIEAQWIYNAYVLMVASLILLGGALGDRFGLARVFGLGIAVFVGASMLCAFSPNATTLIAARVLQGLGAAIMMPGSLALVARAYPRGERGRAIGVWAAWSALTTALGPILGGLALSFGGPEMWRVIFAVNLPLGALALWLLWRFAIRDDGQPGKTLDLPGAACATAALFAIAWGLTANGEAAAPQLIWIGAGLVLLLVFVRIEARAAHPMMPLSLFSSRVFSAANLLSFLIYGALSIMFFFMPMTFVAAWSISEIEASAAFAPMSVFLPLLSARAGKLADRIGPAPLLATGCVCVAAGYGLIGWLAPAREFWGQMLPAMCVVGFGMALIVAPLSTAIMSTVEETRTGIASAINNAVARMAGLVGVAAVGGFVARLYANAGGTDSFGMLSTAPGHADAMTAAFQGLSFLAAAIALAGFIAALFTRP